MEKKDGRDVPAVPVCGRKEPSMNPNHSPTPIGIKFFGEMPHVSLPIPEFRSWCEGLGHLLEGKYPAGFLATEESIGICIWAPVALGFRDPKDKVDGIAPIRYENKYQGIFVFPADLSPQGHALADAVENPDVVLYMAPRDTIGEIVDLLGPENLATDFLGQRNFTANDHYLARPAKDSETRTMKRRERNILAFNRFFASGLVQNRPMISLISSMMKRRWMQATMTYICMNHTAAMGMCYSTVAYPHESGKANVTLSDPGAVGWGALIPKTSPSVCPGTCTKQSATSSGTVSRPRPAGGVLGADNIKISTEEGDNMSARIISGKEVAASVREAMKPRVAALAEKGIKPGLAVVLVGDDPASRSYVTGKEKACADLGFASFPHHLPADTSQEDLMALVAKLNADPAVHGILVQLPLPKGLDEGAVVEAIAPEKDVDGFHPVSVGKMTLGKPGFVPCTPAGVIEMLKFAEVETRGKHVVVVGRSDIVGKPLSLLFLRKGPYGDATVTVAHSRTPDLAAIVRQADIVVAAVGRPDTVTADMVKPGAVVIDVGVNRVEDATKKQGFRLVGDVDYEALLDVASAITPVPGGVGPMTITMLMANTLQSAEQAAGK
jgi:methylenetetrahydrofolate dehydrogenase (NADP+)/methenyltetrahydrofolate cyclohydrolase